MDLKGQKCSIHGCPFDARMLSEDNKMAMCAGHFMVMCVAMWAEQNLKKTKEDALNFANQLSDVVVEDILSKGLEVQLVALKDHKELDD